MVWANTCSNMLGVNLGPVVLRKTRQAGPIQVGPILCSVDQNRNDKLVFDLLGIRVGETCHFSPLKCAVFPLWNRCCFSSEMHKWNLMRPLPRQNDPPTSMWQQFPVPGQLAATLCLQKPNQNMESCLPSRFTISINGFQVQTYAELKCKKIWTN